MNRISMSAFSALMIMPLLVVWPAQAGQATATLKAPYQVSLKFNAPKKKAPPSTAGGATRGFCAIAESEKVATPLIPKDEIGLTLAARPSFFFFVPSSPAKTAEFLLLSDDDTEIVYQHTFKLPNRAGVVEFALPEDAPELEVGKQYHWFITLGCDTAMGASGNPTVEGWIERTEAPSKLVQALQKATIGSYPTVYAESGIWYETLSSLASQRRQSPNSTRPQAEWRDLLKSVGLESIASEPLAN